MRRITEENKTKIINMVMFRGRTPVTRTARPRGCYGETRTLTSGTRRTAQETAFLLADDARNNSLTVFRGEDIPESVLDKEFSTATKAIEAMSEGANATPSASFYTIVRTNESDESSNWMFEELTY